MGFLDFLSPALTVGTQAAGTYQQAKAQANDRNTKNFMQSAMLLKQQHDDEINQQLRGAQTAEANARTNMILNPAETWGDAEDVQGEDGKLQRVLRSNRGNIRPIGAPPPKPPQLGDPAYLKAEADLARVRANAADRTTTTTSTTIRPHVERAKAAGGGAGFYIDANGKFVMGTPPDGGAPSPSPAPTPRPPAAKPPARPAGWDDAKWNRYLTDTGQKP